MRTKKRKIDLLETAHEDLESTSKMNTPRRTPKQVNPFRVPEDNEFFQIRDKTKEEKELKRQKINQTPLYKRTPDSSRSNIRRRIQQTPSENSAEENALAQIILTPETGKTKEGLREFIQQKREIFLSQLAIDTKREELQRLERLEREEEKSLREKETEINLFQEQFKAFLENDGKETMRARLNAEEKSKERIKVTMEIKQISSQMSNLRNEIAHHDEKLQECQQYKEFLDSLTPKEWLKNHPDELYFKDPNQLLEIIHSLEEQNMFLIHHCQEAEEAVERYREKFSKLLEERDGHIMEMTERQKEEMEILKASTEKNEHYRMKGEFRLGTEFSEEELSELLSMISSFYKQLGFDGAPSNDAASMLCRIEGKMEYLIQEISQVDPFTVKKLAQVKEYQRREAARVENVKRTKQIQNEKRAKTLALAKQPIKRKTGRPLVPRNVPKVGQSKQEKEELARQAALQEQADQELLYGDIWD